MQKSCLFRKTCLSTERAQWQSEGTKWWMKPYFNLFMSHQNINAAVLLLTAFDQCHTPVTTTFLAHYPELTLHFVWSISTFIAILCCKANIVIPNVRFGKIRLLRVKLQWSTYVCLRSQSADFEMAAIYWSSTNSPRLYNEIHYGQELNNYLSDCMATWT